MMNKNIIFQFLESQIYRKILFISIRFKFFNQMVMDLNQTINY